jgi:hypothetical protein
MTQAYFLHRTVKVNGRNPLMDSPKLGKCYLIANNESEHLEEFGSSSQV